MMNIRYWCFAIIVVAIAFTVSCVRLNIKASKPAAIFKTVPVHQVVTPHKVEKVIPPQVEPKKKPKMLLIWDVKKEHGIDADPMEAIYEADRLLQEKFAPSIKKGE